MKKPNKTDAGNGSYGICHVIDASRSPSPDPKRSLLKMTIKIICPHCTQRIEAPGEVIGTIVACPTCSGEFHVGRRPVSRESPSPEMSESKTREAQERGLKAIPVIAARPEEPRAEGTTESRRSSTQDVAADRMKMKKFEVWVPGFHNSDPYIYEKETCLGEYEAPTFKEACEKAIAAKNLQLDYRKIDNTWFGRRLSANQEEAKKNCRYGN